jgi:hypothetical protein
MKKFFEPLEKRRLLSTTYFVAAGGSDGNSGTSASDAFASLQQAANRVKAGDTVMVEAGSYAGFEMTGTTGTASAPIVFDFQSGADVTSSNGSTGDAIDIENCNYVTVEGATITNDGGDITRAGIRLAECDNFQILDNNVNGMGEWGLYTSHSSDGLIEGNVAANSINQHGIYVANSSSDDQIIGNVIYGNANCGIHINGDASQGDDGIMTGFLVANNIIYDNGATGGSSINCDGVQDSVIENNLIYDNQNKGICLFQGDSAGASINDVVVNNTIVETDNVPALEIVDGSTGAVVFNNILIGSQDIDSASESGLTTSHNITSGDSSLFVNAAIGNFELASGSAASGAGVASVNGESAPTSDILGTAVSSFSDGAFNSASTGLVFTLPSGDASSGGGSTVSGSSGSGSSGSGSTGDGSTGSGSSGSGSSGSGSSGTGSSGTGSSGSGSSGSGSSGSGSTGSGSTGSGSSGSGSSGSGASGSGSSGSGSTGTGSSGSGSTGSGATGTGSTGTGSGDSGSTGSTGSGSSGSGSSGSGSSGSASTGTGSSGSSSSGSSSSSGTSGTGTGDGSGTSSSSGSSSDGSTGTDSGGSTTTDPVTPPPLPAVGIQITQGVTPATNAQWPTLVFLSSWGVDSRGLPVTYTWTASGPDGVTFSSNGDTASNSTVAILSQAGTYTFTVTMTSADGAVTSSAASYIVNQQVASVYVYGAQSLINADQAQQFSAFAVDQFGQAMSVNPASILWSTNGLGSISATGGYLAPIVLPGGASQANAQIYATIGGVVGGTTLTIAGPAGAHGPPVSS